MTTIVTSLDTDLNDDLTVLRLAMDAAHAETIGDLAEYCKMRGTSPKALVENARIIRMPEIAHLDLDLGDHTLTVYPTLWDDDTACIALIHDGINDQRTPVVTAAEARRLGEMLTTMADSLEAR